VKNGRFWVILGGPTPKNGQKSSNFAQKSVKNRDFWDTKTVSGVHIIYIAMCSWGSRESPKGVPKRGSPRPKFLIACGTHIIYIAMYSCEWDGFSHNHSTHNFLCYLKSYGVKGGGMICSKHRPCRALRLRWSSCETAFLTPPKKSLPPSLFWTPLGVSRHPPFWVPPWTQKGGPQMGSLGGGLQTPLGTPPFLDPPWTPKWGLGTPPKGVPEGVQKGSPGGSPSGPPQKHPKWVIFGGPTPKMAKIVKKVVFSPLSFLTHLPWGHFFTLGTPFWGSPRPMEGPREKWPILGDFGGSDPQKWSKIVEFCSKICQKP